MAAVLAIGTTIPGIAYVLAPDVLYVESIHGDVTARAITAYNNSGVVTAATLVFLVGHVVGLALLGVALWRVGSVPRWAAVCLALSPLLEIGGAAADVRAIGVVAYLLLMAAFGACAVGDRSSEQLDGAGAGCGHGPVLMSHGGRQQRHRAETIGFHGTHGRAQGSGGPHCAEPVARASRRRACLPRCCSGRRRPTSCSR